ncbi:J domain-containing protein [Candidatus Rhabdochlamydia sp. T3358]|uniref:J domain-containing protein n=1 Tax=Candidatus Rhabdochlamydia sp. T3358 TaxID=2099795 RepID=UPI0010BBA589|nr:J domain-containing protein [Candidatus Rhabdochlamydia sp. T3358]VHO04403.1 DnaJ domain protein [Candidatus Rhabdochlamydia sp. T3358]
MIIDVYPSAFQWIERPLYYLNEQRNKSILSGDLDEKSFSITCLVINALFCPIIMCSIPLTALVDIGIGACEAFYAKYKGATSHRITLIIQKKIIASPIQHLAYVITNLLAPFFAGTALALGLFRPGLIIPLTKLYAIALCPMLASINYQLAQIFIGKLPAWTRPEEFNIFINGGCLDHKGRKITDEDYGREKEYNEWKSKQLAPAHQTELNSLREELKGKATILNAYQSNNVVELKKFSELILNEASVSELLGLKPGFQMQEIKDAYRKWVLILHPDKNKDIQEIAEILIKILNLARFDLEKQSETGL